MICLFCVTAFCVCVHTAAAQCPPEIPHVPHYHAPLCHHSPYSIPASTPIPRAFTRFRAMPRSGLKISRTEAERAYCGVVELARRGARRGQVGVEVAVPRIRPFGHHEAPADVRPGTGPRALEAEGETGAAAVRRGHRRDALLHARRGGGDFNVPVRSTRSVCRHI